MKPTLFAFLGKRLAVLLVLGAVILTLASSAVWWRHVRHVANENAADWARLVVQAIEERLALAQATVGAVTLELDAVPSSRWQEEVVRIEREQPLFTRLLLTDDNGLVQASSDLGVLGWDLSRHLAVLGALQHGSYVSSVLIDPRTGGPMVEMARRGRGFAVVAALEMSILQRLVERLSRESEVVVTDHRGRLVAHPNAQRVQERQTDPWSGRFATVDDWGLTTTEDEHFLGVLARIQPVGWMVVVRLPKQSLVRPVLVGAVVFAGLGAVGVVVGLLLARHLAGRVAMGLHLMVQQAAAVAAGEYDARVLPQGILELDALAESMNQMAMKVQQRESDNTQLNLELEDQLAHIQELAALTRSLFESVAEGIIALDALGRVVLANEAAYHIFDTGQMVPQWQEDSWHWPFAEAVLAARPQRGQMALPSGRILDYAFVPMPQRGRVYGVVSFIDVTEREATIHAQEEARRLAEEANRMKDEFLANMSHELRTPLNGIMGVLQLLRLEDLPESQREQVDMALDSARNLLRILTDLLELSRTAAGFAPRLAPVDAVAVAQQALALVRTQTQRNGVATILEAEPELWVETDEVRLRQILLNLVGNAAKFTRQGEIIVRLDRIVSADGQQRLLLQVEDTGIGMITSHVPQVFERFRQEDSSSTRKYQGAGLGLAVVKRLVDLMGGTISVDTAPGQGFWISICLPMRHGTPLLKEEPSSSPSDDLPHYGLRILLVEDDDVNRYMARALLAKLGCHVDEAVNGLEALERLRRESYDLALLDIQMPEMDGLQTAQAIRAYPEFTHLATMPLVALTAHALPEDEARARAAGMEYFLTKPLDIHLLMATLDRIVERLAL